MDNILQNWGMPPSMENYLQNYGYHFNKKSFLFAISNLKQRNISTGQLEKLVPFEWDDVLKILSTNKVDINNSVKYDVLYLANFLKANFLYHSIPTEKHMAMFLKDYFDNPQYNGELFKMWYISSLNRDNPVIWDDLV